MTIDIRVARYWEDPKTFRPSRFLEENWPRDAFLPFSGGMYCFSLATSPNLL